MLEAKDDPLTSAVIAGTIRLPSCLLAQSLVAKMDQVKRVSCLTRRTDSFSQDHIYGNCRSAVGRLFEVPAREETRAPDCEKSISEKFEPTGPYQMRTS